VEGLVIRPARPDEAALLSDLALRSKAHWGYSKEFMDACRAELTYTAAAFTAADLRFFVAERDRGIVGFYTLRRHSAVEIELDALFVEPAQIGTGCGRTLMDHAKRTALQLGARRMHIQSDPNAERFYLAAGGVRTGASESASVPGRMLPMFEIDLARAEVSVCVPPTAV
jgi:GNAT superfamily N-acetyltransferase